MKFGDMLKKLMLPARQGIRANWLPGIVLQSIILIIVVSYYQTESVRGILDRIGELKRQWGFAYAAAATALFGGLIPFLVLLVMGRIRRGRALPELLFYVAFWCWKGVEVDALYRLQGAMFGQSAACSVIIAKVLVDQFVYNTLWASPTQAVCFLWKDGGFSIRAARQALTTKPLRTRVLEVLVSTWLIWIPAVSFIYMLPSALQIPLFNLVLCFWTLLLTFVARGNEASKRE